MTLNNSNWDETKHPRDNEGKFTCTGGSGSSTSNEDRLRKEREEKARMQRAADILYPTTKDNKNGESPSFENVRLKGGISKIVKAQKQHELKNEIAVDHIDNAVAKSLGIYAVGYEAAENLHMSKADSYLDTDYAKKHTIFNNCNELNGELRSYFKEKISSQIGADKIEDTKGIFIDPKSNSTKEITKALMENKDFMSKLNNIVKTLKPNQMAQTSVQFKDKNFHNAIGKADVGQIHFDKNGNIDALILDVYDFNKNDPSDLVQVARERQEKGKIKPYFIIYHVTIPKEKLKK